MTNGARKGGRLAVVDLGQSKFSVAVAEMVSDRNYRIVGFGEAKAEGMERGKVINIEEMSAALKNAVRRAETMSGTGAEDLYVGVSGNHVCGNTHAASTYISGETVSREDVDQVMNTAQAHQLMVGERILHVLEQTYSINRHNGIKRPIGMGGELLEGSAHVISMDSQVIGNIERGFERAGRNIIRTVSNHVASAMAVLAPEEKELGTIVVDCGAGGCEIAVFRRGVLARIDTLGQGGHDIDNDISKIYRTSAEEARRRKHEHGSVLADGGGGRHDGERDDKLSEIIRARAETIVRGIDDLIKSLETGDVPGGIVLTGGGANLDGFGDLLSDACGIPVRVGAPAYAGENAELVSRPEHASLVGLVELCCHEHETHARNTRGMAGWLASMARDLVQVGR